MRDLVIFGSTTFAQLAHYYATHELKRNVRAFVVDSGYKNEAAVVGVPLVEWPQAQQDFLPDSVDFFVAIGYKNMRKRAEVYARVKAAGYTLCNLISPASYCAENIRMGDNTIIMPGAVVEPNASIGCNNVIWSNATICHDGVIGDHNFIAANATLGGHVVLGNLNFIGFSATIEQNLRVGDETLIGAQSLVRESTRGLHKYWGVPATAQAMVDSHKGIEID